MKKVLNKLIRRSQSAFIEGRSISYNILLSHELFMGYTRKWISLRCVLKVDINKAYDTLTNRMKKVLNELIKRSQSAFIEGRSISDNILLSHELFMGYTRKWISPRCVLKVDISKAYDTLKWAAMNSILLLQETLDKFSCAFGLKTNLEKSSIYIAAWVVKKIIDS
ncbi:hypothetical protein RDI58_007508 [Solanum bulbocastanum]|uniref:Reverse transcriptase domain-containing protein n=1 Tax=Solanum bulbocastanum TaxID=147425 RepID=A0AAN8TV46_SOLBU